ncbi:MAG: phenylalanine--tRNA ligase subunit alpha [Candidatus Eremiobacteraeota bacterium]|nr:phenylalanine--tRNA ligase subunit alpha [Candidatus Eremiobacteraeota bacterium]
MDDQLAELADDVVRQAAAAQDAARLDALRTEVLGRKGGRLSRVMAAVASVPKDRRAEFGRHANDAKARIEEALDRARARLDEAALEATLGQGCDVTFPGIATKIQPLHVLRRTLDDVADFFRCRGFAIVIGPEIETEHYNFEAMNIPADHPARDSMDTFYLTGGNLLRTHTSPMQVRSMERYRPPLAILVPGKVYRRDALDARHSFAFHQIEGLHVDKDVCFGHLKGFANDLCAHLFGPKQRTRFRPSYFQFTEPSAEVDVSCPLCDGAGCRTCGGSGWLEMGGSGMVHPRVLAAAGYDPQTYSGWAWGLGIERIAMARHGIDDIRVFTENDPAALDRIA